MPWLPVGFGLDIALYFTAEHEPVWWVTAALAAAAIACACVVRGRPVAFPVVLAFVAIASGFATATIKSRLVDHVVLRAPAYGVIVKGFVERREELERSDRIVVGVVTMDGARLTDHPQRIRVSVRKGMAPAVGAFVALKARINGKRYELARPPSDYERVLKRVGIQYCRISSMTAGMSL